MSLLQATLVATAAACYLMVAVGVFVVFTTPAGTPSALWVVRVVVMSANVVEVAVIATAGGIRTGPGLSGCVLYAGSAALFLWCAAVTRGQRLSIAFSPDGPAHVFKEGPFRRIRHPFYASYVLSYVAGFVATLDPWLAGAALAVMAVFHRAAVFEERKFLQGALAGEYEVYQREAGMYFPRPRARR